MRGRGDLGMELSGLGDSLLGRSSLGGWFHLLPLDTVQQLLRVQVVGPDDFNHVFEVSNVVSDHPFDYHAPVVEFLHYFLVLVAMALHDILQYVAATVEDESVTLRVPLENVVGQHVLRGRVESYDLGDVYHASYALVSHLDSGLNCDDVNRWD